MKPLLEKYLDMNPEVWKQHCTNCMNPISEVMFACTHCEDSNFCMQCYICGAEIGPHKRTHPVKMVDLGTFCVFGKRKAAKKVEGKTAETYEDLKCRPKKCKDESCKLYVSGDESTDEDDAQSESRLKKSGKFHYEMDRGQLVKIYDNKDKGKGIGKKDRVWRALDELELLDAISRFGYGNWKDIAQTLSNQMPGVTPEEVADHYAIYYVLADIGDYTWDWKHDSSRIIDIFNTNEERKTFGKTPENNFDDVSQTELDALGFMPKRDDFEREFDNEAEALIANLTVTPGEEDEIEKKFKLAQIEMYQQRLVERFRKKAVVRKYGLVRKFLQANKLKQEGDEKSDRPINVNIPSTSTGITHETSSIFSPFLRFGTAETLQSLYLDLQRELYLKLLIRKLLKYKRRGVSKLSEIKEFEALRKSNREKAKQLLDSLPMETDEVQDSSSEKSDSDDEDEYGLSLNDANFDRIMATVTTDKLQEILSVFITERTKELENPKAKVKEENEEEEDEEELKAQPGTSSQKSPRKSRRRSQIKSVEPSTNDSFDVTAFRGSRQLSSTEKKLCSELKLQPLIFTQLKSLVIREFTSKTATKNRRITLPFILVNEPASMQANLISIFGSNVTYDEVDRVMNRVVKHMIAIGDISKH